jgi:hypothetical protein
MKWLQVFILIIAAEKLLELLEFAVVGASGNRLHAIISPFVNSVASAVGAGVSKAVHAAVFPAATLTSTPGDVCATERAAAYLWTACFVLLVLLSMANILYWHKHPLNPLSDKSSPSWVVADLKSRGWFSKCTWAVKVSVLQGLKACNSRGNHCKVTARHAPLNNCAMDNAACCVIAFICSYSLP